MRSAIPTPSVRRACASHFRSATGHRPEQQADRGPRPPPAIEGHPPAARARRALLSYLWGGGSACLRSARPGRLSDGLVDRCACFEASPSAGRAARSEARGATAGHWFETDEASKLSFDPQVTGSKPMKSRAKAALKHRSRRRIYEPWGKENPRVVMPRWHTFRHPSMATFCTARQSWKNARQRREQNVSAKRVSYLLHAHTF